MTLKAVAITLALLVGGATADAEADYFKKKGVPFSQGSCGARDLDAKRVVYNRVGKAGSTTFVTLVKRLIRRPGGGIHTLKYPSADSKQYHMPADWIEGEMARLPEHAIFINHMASPADFDGTRQAFMNIVREPVARACSEFYYHGTTERGRACACEGCIFEDFLRKQIKNNCSQPIFKSWIHSNFCPVRGTERDGHCTVEQAMAHVERAYAFVGITEHYELSVAALEAMMPNFFRGASCEYASLSHANAHKRDNSPMGRAAAGCPSNVTRALLRRQDPTFVELERFYEILEARFWCQVSKLGLATKPTPKKCA